MSPRDGAGGRWRRLAPPALVASAVLLLYAPAVGRGFTSEDFLLLRFLREQPPWHDLPALFAEPWLGVTVVRFLRPLATLVLAAEAAVFGSWAPGYGGAHVLVHVATTLMVWRVALRLLSPRGDAAAAPGGPPAADPGERWLAAGSALVFGLYPLHPNAVSFVASFATLFAGALLVAALLAFLRFRAGQRGGRGLALTCHALALGCYEAAVVLPVWLAAWDHLAARRRGGPSHFALARGWLPFAALSGAYLAWRVAVFGVVLGGYEATGERLAAARAGALLRDLLLSLERLHLPLFAPAGAAAGAGQAGVSAALGRAWDAGETDPVRAAAVVALAAGAPLLLAAVRRPAAWLRPWAFGWVVVLSGLAPFAFEPVVPATGRYAYLAVLGLALGAGAVASGLAQAGRRHRPALGVAALAAVAAGWAVLLAGNVRTHREAATTAAEVTAQLAAAAAVQPGRTLFLTGYPYFLTGEGGTPLAQVFHYGLRDAARPPFHAPALDVYPLPPLAGAELLPVLASERPPLLLEWHAATREARPAAPAARPELPVFAPVDLPQPPRRGRDPAAARDVRVAVRVPPGGPHASFRLLLAAPINGVVLPVTAKPGPARVLRPRVPGELVAAVDRLYAGETIWWWVEARDAAGAVSGYSPMRPLPAP